MQLFQIWWREYSYSSEELSRPQHIKLKEKHTMYVIIKPPKINTNSQKQPDDILRWDIKVVTYFSPKAGRRRGNGKTFEA